MSSLKRFSTLRSWVSMHFCQPLSLVRLLALLRWGYKQKRLSVRLVVNRNEYTVQSALVLFQRYNLLAHIEAQRAAVSKTRLSLKLYLSYQAGRPAVSFWSCLTGCHMPLTLTPASLQQLQLQSPGIVPIFFTPGGGLSALAGSRRGHSQPQRLACVLLAG